MLRSGLPCPLNLNYYSGALKLQKEREKARTEKKKDKRREKNEQKKGKEEKAKRKASDHSHEAYGVLQKVEREENEQLERSGITEEHELPVNSQNPSYSSDSIQNSNKRKRHDSPVSGGHTRSSGGNILRFRFPSQKNMDSKGSKDVAEVLSTSAKMAPLKNENAETSKPQLDKLDPNILQTDSTLQSLSLRTGEPSQSTSQQIDNFSLGNIMHPNHVSKKFKKQHKALKKYTGLMGWVPPSQPSVDYDEEWLSRRDYLEPDNTVKVVNLMSCSNSCLLWPRAQHLHEADMYALPYVIPF